MQSKLKRSEKLSGLFQQLHNGSYLDVESIEVLQKRALDAQNKSLTLMKNIKDDSQAIQKEIEVFKALTPSACKRRL